MKSVYKIDEEIVINKKRRKFGAHLTSIDIFKEFILPEIKEHIWEYSWIDLFAGEGNLVLPLLECVELEKRIKFFKEHIFLFDIQEQMVKKAISNAEKYGVPYNIAKENIQKRDTLKDHPEFIKTLKYPPFHVTNPPYLYLGYIQKKAKEHLQYFLGHNKGYQDLYQIALINDLRQGLKKMIYIIPTNFLFGYSSSNKIRKDFFYFYNIKKAIIFETKIFEFTGTNVCVCFFEKKAMPNYEPIIFKALKINKKFKDRKYILRPKNLYRAGVEFSEFVNKYKLINHLKVSYYLTLEEIENNPGKHEVKLIDVNDFSNGKYAIRKCKVNEKLYKKIKANPLFVRTIDTGKWNGRAGLYLIKEVFKADGLVVTRDKYRTHPIQIFLTPTLSLSNVMLLKDYFNNILESLREKTDSEFMTTYKYSNAEYIRKYLGLSQTKNLIKTFPVHLLSDGQKNMLGILIEQNDMKGIKDILSRLNEKNKNQFKLI